MAEVARISDRFYKQLEKARSVLSDFMGREVTFVEITDKLFLKVVILNKAPDGNMEEIFADWDMRPIVIMVNGVKRHRNRRANLEFEKLFTFSPHAENLWRDPPAQKEES